MVAFIYSPKEERKGRKISQGQQDIFHATKIEKKIGMKLRGKIPLL